MRPLGLQSIPPGLKWTPVLLVLVCVFLWQHADSPRNASAASVHAFTRISSSKVNPAIRLTGSISALKSVTMTAPRVLGSRTALNRGGDFNAGGSGPMGGAGADFNLVLLSVVPAGTHVKTGDVVARFDPQNQLQRLDDYNDAVVQSEANIRSMKANLAAAKEAEDQSVRGARSDWDQATLDLKTIPVLSTIDAEKARLTVEQDKATYQQLVKESSLVDSSQQAQLRAAELSLSQVRLELQRARNNVEKMTLRAPIDGIVVMATVIRNGEYGQIREGDQVNAGQQLLTIVDESSMVLNATVNQVDAERLKLGMHAVVRLDAYPDVVLPGVVDGIGAMAVNSTMRANYVGEIPVRVQIQGGDPRAIPDLTGSAEIGLTAAHI
jgi:HlyD family secretion protein